MSKRTRGRGDAPDYQNLIRRLRAVYASLNSHAVNAGDPDTAAYTSSAVQALDELVAVAGGWEVKELIHRYFPGLLEAETNKTEETP